MTEGSVARDAILDMLGRSTVLFSSSDQANLGSGFFIAPGIVLTCAHVVLACGENPRVVSRGGSRWRVRRIVSSRESASASVDPEYLPFPDLALVYVEPVDRAESASETDASIRCAWLTHSNTPDAGSRLMAVTPQRVYLATGPAIIPLTFQWQTGTQVPGAFWVAAPVSPEGMNIHKGMSGSPVLDEDTLRVVGIVKASADEGLVHITPVGGGLSSLASILHRRGEKEGSQPLENPAIEAWHAHDLYHAGFESASATGFEAGLETGVSNKTGEWPAYLAHPASANDDSGEHSRPARRALGPLREASLFGLISRAEQPYIGKFAESLYRICAQKPDGQIFPGPIQCLRDAAWHLARAGESVDQARLGLGLFARHVAAAALSYGYEDLASELHAWAQDAPPATRAQPPTKPELKSMREPAEPEWPAGVLVKITQSFSSSPRYPRYHGEISVLDDHGNWRHSFTYADSPLTLTLLLDRLRAPLQVAVDALGPTLPVVEFVVPRSLFDHPFDRWESSDGVPLGEQFPVVIRDRTTFDESSSHSQSVRSWELFSQPGGLSPAEVTCAELPERGNTAQQELFRGRLRGTPPQGKESLKGRVVLLPGRAAPDEDAGAAMDALRQTRTPLALWTSRAHPHGGPDDHPPCSGALFTTIAADGVRGVPVAILPRTLYELRQQARMDELQAAQESGVHSGMNADNHPLAYAVLLWDPPHRKPDASAFAVPGSHAPSELV